MTIVIAGGGVIGTSTAYYLAKRNVPVTIVDPAGIAQAASGKAGGFLAKEWRDGTPVEELHRLGFDLHQSLANDLQEDIGYRRLTCAAVSVDEKRVLNKPPSKKLKDVEWVDKGVIGSVPMGSEENIAQVHPQKLCMAMWDYAKKEVGSDLVTGRVVRAILEEDKTDSTKHIINGVELDNGTILPATQLVIACGPWTSEANSWFGSNVSGASLKNVLPEITGVKCHSILVKSPNRVLNQAVFFESDGKLGDGDLEVYPRPDSDCYVNGFPGEESVVDEKPGKEIVEDEAIQLLVDAMAQTSTELGGLEPHTKQACYWPETSSGFPIIGRLQQVKNAVVATGHSVWGILQGPSTGKVLAELLVDGKASSVDLTPFRLESYLPIDDNDDHPSDVMSVRGGGVDASSTNAIGQDVSYILKKAMEASNRISDIENAEMACSQWERVLADDIRENLPPNVLALSRLLYAACLVRLGRDQDAILVYDSYLSQANVAGQTVEGITKSRLGKAECLQRLLRYQEAMDEFVEQMNVAENRNDKLQACWGAVRSALRIGSTSTAIDICSRCVDTVALDDSTADVITMDGLRTCLKHIEGQHVEDTFERLKDSFVQWSMIDRTSAVAKTSISSMRSTKYLFGWILILLSPLGEMKNVSNLVRKVVKSSSIEEDFLILAQINTSPLDDPDLSFLDDKIELHKLLTESTITPLNEFWPEGIVLPRESILVEEISRRNPSSLWILKKRAGYGSHGNSILSGDTLLEFAVSRRQDGPEESDLLQLMVKDPLLIRGKKFSLRIYCVYFSPTVVFIATQGLIKFASLPFVDESSLDPSIHMTNSGRASETSQCSVDVLWEELALANSNTYRGDVWERIRDIATQVLQQDYSRCQYRRERKEAKANREKFLIPKILGLDFVMDNKKQPWLVEVNRFPGLEPRDESDRNIKYQVVRDAWRKAGELISMHNHSGDGDDDDDAGVVDFHPFEDLLDQFPCVQEDSCLEPLVVHSGTDDN